LRLGKLLKAVGRVPAIGHLQAVARAISTGLSKSVAQMIPKRLLPKSVQPVGLESLSVPEKGRAPVRNLKL